MKKKNKNTGFYKVFVYGSLKRGFGNNDFLKDSTFLKETETLENTYHMISLGVFPGVIKNGACRVSGEVYLINKSTFVGLDYLEGNGSLYNRELIKLASGDEAWMYFFTKSWAGDGKGIGYSFGDDSIIIQNWLA